MDQVGDTKTFSVTPTPAVNDIYAYVWEWWDQTVDATVGSLTTKRINIGGDPRTTELHMICHPVQIDGQMGTIAGTITANNPPVVVPPIAIAANNAYFPYASQVSVTAFDFENSALTFNWYENSVFLGAGASSAAANVFGTWTGNGTTLIQQYPSTNNVFSLTVSSNRTLDLFVNDGAGGTTALTVQLYGSQKPPPLAGVQAAATAITTDASSVPTARIGPARTIDFEVYAKDATAGTVLFLWTFAGSNNWTTGPMYTTGNTQSTPDGGFANKYTKDISGEVVASGTQKTATALVRVGSGANTQELPFSVVLIQNTPPTGITFTAKRNGADYNLATLSPITTGDKMELDAIATDPDTEVIQYYWVITQPLGVLPSVLRLWGGKVVIDTTGYPTNSFLQATVTAYDRMTGSIQVLTPAIPVG